MSRLLCILVPIVSFAQQPTPRPAAPRPTTTESPSSLLQNQISEMRKQIEALREEVKNLDGRLKGSEVIARFHREKVDSVIKNSVLLDPSEKGYGVITTDQGKFFISLDNVEPFLDGYRIVLRIGNPYAITFRDVRISADWNKKMPSDFAKYAEWAESKRTQEFSESTELKPGSWTTFRLALTETKSDQLGYLEVKLTTKGVRMSL